jgi:hypothetical protein
VTATPLTDIRKALKKAKTDGNKIMYAYMDDVTFENFAKTQQVKDFYITANNIFTDNAIVPAPTLEKVNAALKADEKYRFQIVLVDRVVINESKGVRTPVTPWSEGKVILTTTTEVGILMWTRLAEQNHPKTGIAYQTVDEYILVSKFSENRPSLKEFTNSQARVVPLICNVEQIYQIDSKIVQV